MKPELVTDARVRSELTDGVVKLCQALVFYARLSDKGTCPTEAEERLHADAVETASDVLALVAASDMEGTDR